MERNNEPEEDGSWRAWTMEMKGDRGEDIIGSEWTS